MKGSFQQVKTIKDELGGKIMKEFCALRPKRCSYLMDDDSEKKKAKGTKNAMKKQMEE